MSIIVPNPNAWQDHVEERMADNLHRLFIRTRGIKTTKNSLPYPQIMDRGEEIEQHEQEIRYSQDL